MSQKIQRTNYRSEATDFLRELEADEQNNRSPARAAEEAKYARVNRLRDKEQAAEKESKIWSGF
ncbi:CBU_0585 family protein [Permianibacter aggregans]|uniref:Uncharacterized protein n=1 Tax=Permianibacter aggregans TaxID=1510150 RepID=A0A4R6V4X3_9GAMM|nr:CBU_0585 family protein [Permianibacter aggregans]QGX41424.1 hypothetical protein E2H98_17825 [Permianibacter aggregans]TDQ51214.1 hypothetical protein EV696_101187 [Permianibacter aggregans]